MVSATQTHTNMKNVSPHQQIDRPPNTRIFAPESKPAQRRDTGFSEPLSKLSNTTLAHKDAISASQGDPDMGVIMKQEHHRHPRWVHHHTHVEDTDKDAELEGAGEYEETSRSKGKLKKVLKKLPCTH